MGARISAPNFEKIPTKNLITFSGQTVIKKKKEIRSHSYYEDEQGEIVY